jgi:hypothetical protein
MMKATIKKDGTSEITKEAWEPKTLKAITLEIKGHLTSTYRYPITATDEITEIVIRTE